MAGRAQQDAPEGYGFDFVNSDVVLHQLSFKDGRLVTPGGTSYRILYLGGRSQRMTLPVLQQLSDLVEQGAVIVGNKPTDSPSLADDEKRVSRVADQLWGTGGKLVGEELLGKVSFATQRLSQVWQRKSLLGHDGERSA